MAKVAVFFLLLAVAASFASFLGIYRYYNPTTQQDHFYTPWVSEVGTCSGCPVSGCTYANHVYNYYDPPSNGGCIPRPISSCPGCASSQDYILEGTNVFYISDTQISGTVPFYRCYSGTNTDHFYTTSSSECTNNGYSVEGVMGYIATSAQCSGTTPLYRSWNSPTTDHFYTTSYSEYIGSQSTYGYNLEGIVGYVWPSSAGGSCATCTSQCSSGQTQCNGNIAQTCVQSGSCWIWANSTCGTGYTCSGGSCVASCTNYCSYSGQTQCTGIGQIMTCGYSGSCLWWSAPSNCPSGQTCSGTSCTATCTNQCTAGSSGCTTAAQKWMCGYNYSIDTCLHKLYSYCPTNYNCASGSCVLGCTNDCTPGAYGCSSSFQKWNCLAGGDGCYHYSYANCGTSQTCSSGSCVSQPDLSVYSILPSQITSIADAQGKCRLDIKAVIKNIGAATSPKYDVSLYVNNTAVWSGANYTGLAAGATEGPSNVGPGNISYPGGAYLAKFVITPKGFDMGSNNNQMSSVFNINCGAACTNQCTPGATQCSGTQLQTCVQNASGCGVWGTPAACQNGYTCSGTGCVPTSAPTCNLSWSPNPISRSTAIPANSTLSWVISQGAIVNGSSGSAAYTCTGSTMIIGYPNQTSGSAKYSFSKDGQCSENCILSVSNGAGQGGSCSASLNFSDCQAPVCVNKCTQGQTNCTGGALANCTQNASGCWVWGTPVSCPSTDCRGGPCLPPICSNQCSQGQTQCAPGGTVQNCVQNASGCWNWGTPTSCQNGYTCSGTSCIPTGPAQNLVNVYLQSPATNYASASAAVTFNFLATTTLSSTLDCKLMIDGVAWARNTDTVNNTATSFTLTNLSISNSHYWEVTCSAVRCT